MGLDPGDQDAIDEWSARLADLTGSSVVDQELLRTLGRTIAEIRQCEAWVAENGTTFTVRDDKGNVRSTGEAPKYRQLRALRESFSRLVSQLDLSTIGRPKAEVEVYGGSAALSLTSNDILDRLSCKIKHPKKRAFLAAFPAHPSVTMCAKAAGVRREIHYEWMRDDEVYREAFAQVKEMGIELLEVEAIRRARDGWDEPVFYKGEKTGTIRKHSDTLLIFMLKAARPHVYKERVGMEHTGPDGGPIRHEVAVTARAELAASLEEINRRLSSPLLEIEGEE